MAFISGFLFTFPFFVVEVDLATRLRADETVCFVSRPILFSGTVTGRGDLGLHRGEPWKEPKGRESIQQ